MLLTFSAFMFVVTTFDKQSESAWTNMIKTVHWLKKKEITNVTFNEY